MENFISFLKSSSIIDLALIFLAISVGALLVLVGIVMLFVARTPKFFFVNLLLALLPLILGIAGAGLRYYRIETAIEIADQELSADTIREIRENVYPENVLTALIGAGFSSLPLLIGICGVILKKRRDNALE